MAFSFDLANVEATFKEVLPEVIRSQLNESTALMAAIEKVEEDIDIGEGTNVAARIPMQFGENPGIGARALMDDLPTSDTAEHDSALVNLKYNYAALIIPGQFLKVASRDATFLPGYVTTQIRALTATARKDHNRQLLGDGTGLLATSTGAAPAANQITVGANELQFTFKRRLIDLIDKPTGTVIATARRITAVNKATNVITYDGADESASINSDTGIFNTGSFNNEMMGLRGINSTANPPGGPLQKIDVAVQPDWAASFIDASLAPFSGNISEDLLQRLEDDADIAAGVEENEDIFYILHHRQRSKFAKTLQTLKRFVNTRELKGGFKALDYNGAALIKERMQPLDRIDRVIPARHKIYQMADWEVLDQAGSSLVKVPNKDAFEQTYFKYAEHVTLQRNAGAFATGLNP